MRLLKKTQFFFTQLISKIRLRLFEKKIKKNEKKNKKDQTDDIYPLW